MNRSRRLPPLLLLLLLTLADEATGQTDAWSEGFSITGNLSSASELYAMHGAPTRRPNASQRFIGAFDINLYGLRTGVQLIYSSEDNRLQQSINQLALSGAYKWARFSAGSIYPSWTSLTLAGSRITGGEVELTPGSFVVAVTGGENRTPVEGDTIAGRLGVYRRMLWGGRVGMGRQGGDHFRITALYARDDSNSVAVPAGVLPEENLVVGLSGGLSLLDNRLVISSEANVSGFNRNLTASRVNVSDIPEWLSGLFAKTISTSLGYSGMVDAQFQSRPFSMNGAFQYISSAYRSLGVASFINDFQELRLQPQFRLLNSRLRVGLGFTWSKNNILNVLDATATRTNLTGTVTYTAGDIATLSFTGMYFVNSLTPGSDSTTAMERRTVLSSIGFSPYLYYDAFGSRHTSSVSVTWQGIRNSGAASSLVPGGTSVTSNFTVYVNHTSTLPARMVIGLNAGLTSANDLDATFGNLTLNVPVIEGLLTASASGNTNTSRGLSYSTTVTGGTLAGIWTPWSHHTFSLTGRINHVATGSSTFTESFLTLTYNLSL